MLIDMWQGTEEQSEKKCRQRGRVVKAPGSWPHGIGSKPTRAFLLCPWKRHFTAHSPAWWCWQAVLNYSHISIKLQADSNILVSPEAGGVIVYPMYQRLRRFPASQEDKYRDKINKKK